jgi:hypothetical protein
MIPALEEPPTHCVRLRIPTQTTKRVSLPAIMTPQLHVCIRRGDRFVGCLFGIDQEGAWREYGRDGGNEGILSADHFNPKYRNIQFHCCILTSVPNVQSFTLDQYRPQQTTFPSTSPSLKLFT